MFEGASWIRGGWTPQPDEYTEYRLAFSAVKEKSYRLHLACDTDYALYRGDKLLAFGQYADYPVYRVYDTLTLDDLDEGENVLSLVVWYQGIDSQTYVVKPSGVIFFLTEEDVPVLVSSPDILSRRAKGYQPQVCRSISLQLGLSFSYDAMRKAGDFSPSCLAEGSRNLVPRPVEKLILDPRVPAEVVQSGGFILQGGNTMGELMMNAALTVYTRYDSLTGQAAAVFSSRKGEDGIYVILDMGRETAGFVDLDFSVAEPCRVIGGWGEHLADGRCRTAIRDRDFSFEYYAREGSNTFLHPFRRLGGRYLQLFFEIDRVELTYAGIRETRYPLTVKWKPSGNLLRDTISEVCINTLRQCMHEHYEDCPWREQALYTLDSRNEMLCSYAAFGETAFPRACLALIPHGLREDGLLSLCYPAGKDYPIPAFSMVYFLQMREYMTCSGDVAFIRESYPFLCRLMAVFLNRRGDDGLIENFTDAEYWNFYEWSEGMCGHLLQEEAPAVEAPLNAFFSLALQELATMAETIGEVSDAERYREAAKAVNRGLVHSFYCPDTRLFESFSNRRHGEYSVLTNSLCLLCGAAEEVDKEVILAILAANGEAGTGMKVIPNTLSMNGFRFDALLREDRERFAPVILDEIDRSYFTMLRQGATSFWETDQGARDPAGSLCHAWSALPIYYYALLLPQEGAGE